MSVRTFARTGSDVARARVAAKRFAQQKGQFAVSVGNVARFSLCVTFVRAHDYVSISGLTLKIFSVSPVCNRQLLSTVPSHQHGRKVVTLMRAYSLHSLAHSLTHALTHVRLCCGDPPGL